MKEKINSNVIIFVLLILAWILPFFQSYFNIVDIGKLDGVSGQVNDTVISCDNWFSGSYADAKQDHLANNFGFREFAIRAQNQIQYSVFGKANANDVIVGKSNYLYEYKYIKAYYGDDFIGTNEINEKIRKLKFIQDTLEKLNKKFILLIAPSKASFFPEYIPSNLVKSIGKNNYDDFILELNKNKINMIDYSLIFRNLKKSFKYPLYPVGGTHWTEYGGYIAFDTLRNYIESQTKFKLPKMEYSKIKMSDAYIGSDNDIGKSINLLFPPDYGKLAYPELNIMESADNIKPNVLIVSDSYWMRMYYTDLPRRMFNSHSFWYYNNFSYDYNNQTEGKKPYDLDLKQEIDKKDIIAIMCTEPNLKAVGWGFIEECYQLFKFGNFTGYDRKRKVQLLIKKLNLIDDFDAYNKIKRIAKRDNKSIDSVACNMAKYLLDLESK